VLGNPNQTSWRFSCNIKTLQTVLWGRSALSSLVTTSENPVGLELKSASASLSLVCSPKFGNSNCHCYRATRVFQVFPRLSRRKRILFSGVEVGVSKVNNGEDRQRLEIKEDRRLFERCSFQIRIPLCIAICFFGVRLRDGGQSYTLAILR